MKIEYSIFDYGQNMSAIFSLKVKLYMLSDVVPPFSTFEGKVASYLQLYTNL